MKTKNFFIEKVSYFGVEDATHFGRSLPNRRYVTVNMIKRIFSDMYGEVKIFSFDAGRGFTKEFFEALKKEERKLPIVLKDRYCARFIIVKTKEAFFAIWPELPVAALPFHQSNGDRAFVEQKMGKICKMDNPYYYGFALKEWLKSILRTRGGGVNNKNYV